MFVRFEDLRIISDENYSKVPLTCPVCNYMMCKDDIADYKKFSCCRHCTLFFAYPNKDKWNDGFPARIVTGKL